MSDRWIAEVLGGDGGQRLVGEVYTFGESSLRHRSSWRVFVRGRDGLRKACMVGWLVVAVVPGGGGVSEFRLVQLGVIMIGTAPTSVQFIISPSSHTEVS